MYTMEFHHFRFRSRKRSLLDDWSNFRLSTADRVRRIFYECSVSRYLDMVIPQEYGVAASPLFFVKPIIEFIKDPMGNKMYHKLKVNT